MPQPVLSCWCRVGGNCGRHGGVKAARVADDTRVAGGLREARRVFTASPSHGAPWEGRSTRSRQQANAHGGVAASPLNPPPGVLRDIQALPLKRFVALRSSRRFGNWDVV